MIDPEVFNYINNKITPETALLKELERETNIKVVNSRMLSGHLQGQLLRLLSMAKAPTNVLEIGTFTGYSAICLASGIKQGGQLITIECNDELLSIANQYFNRSGLYDTIRLINGDALIEIPKLNLLFDLVYIDGDKQEYPLYYDIVLNKLNQGAMVIADNVLWNKKVIDPSAINDKATDGIIKYTQKMLENVDFESVILPIRDGLMISVKKI